MSKHAKPLKTLATQSVISAVRMLDAWARATGGEWRVISGVAEATDGATTWTAVADYRETDQQAAAAKALARYMLERGELLACWDCPVRATPTTEPAACTDRGSVSCCPYGEGFVP